MGQRAVLVELESLGAVLALHARLAAAPPEGVVDLVPAARTVLVHFDPARLSPASVRGWVARAQAGDDDSQAAPGEVVELDVAYDGADLSETAELLGLSPAELVRRHLAARWQVAFTGFAPGFAYLVSDDWRFEVPRLATPRTRVPAGAVGLAAGFTGAYPRESPGGWRLIGTTPARLFDADAEPAALLRPGDAVRLREVDPGAVANVAGPSAPAAAHPVADPGIRILEPGLLATVQDLGREGRAASGIARSGALDRTALRTGNRLVGNPEGAAGIEVVMGGLRAVAERDLWCAVTGAWGAIRIGSRAVDPYEAVHWPASAELRLEPFERGLRAVLAVRGGIETPLSAGARASDLLAGLGHRPLAPGDRLPVGVPAGPVPVREIAPWGAPADEALDLELSPGPRADWFDEDSNRVLFEAEWAVTDRSDRVGMRLRGPGLRRVREGELASEGMVPGAIQVPPSGQPTILLADGPVTGGYPVIAVVADRSLDALAQARPGTRLRFRHAHL